MSSANENPLRLRVPVLLVLVMWASAILPTRLTQFSMTTVWFLMVGLGGAMLAYAGWWLAFSRVTVADRVSGVLLMIGALVAGVQFTFHHTAGQFMPMLVLLLPGVFTAVTFGMLLSKSLPWGMARWVVAAWMLMAVVVWSGVRVDGSDGRMALQLSWRGLPTAEEVFLAQRGQQEGVSGVSLEESQGTVTLAEGDWPCFRGPQQDAVYHGPPFPTDWNLHAPKQLWRRRVGPGWSSFAVIGDRLYTQEQRGEQEATVCYNGNTGDEAWAATTDARFYKVESGVGPLATPSFYEGAIFSCGAAGAVMRLDAATGAVGWRRQLTTDLPRDTPPEWGFASSLLLVPHDGAALAIVYVGNPDPTGESSDAASQAVIAYHSDTGEPAWTAGVGNHAYCTPVLASLGGVDQVLCASNAGLESLAPATGERLWFYEWPTGEFPRIAQPIIVDDETVVLASGYGFGAHGIQVSQDTGEWKTDTLWQSRNLRPYFNDCVHHDGYVYGFDDKFFTCLDVRTGKLAWPKRTRRQTQFGCGQVVLAERSGALLVMTEHTGELVLLAPRPDGPQELSRMKVLEGKTWNHPVLAHGRLYVRNGVEAACYQLPALDIATRSTGDGVSR
ncbi:outer membrane biogenesis protein BamB [Posidoniimonas corsicana]|uniref:Outer membrane biogenesis protein BamB n=1 Tax=Posidoniimonas corsicana TaxID=1938618 RepID=A0A5C5V0J8_9BACT|nr:PQQ-binding-like beta-propeller repeat protein [Posidoniimonas corsicana]TWT31272.1 outer membrane biogenesis protein BamB [Posidoniimonas corsicana]